MNTPCEIRPIIDQLMKSPKLKRRWTQHLIQTMWVDCVGVKMAQHIRPDNLKDDQLTVLIDDDKWAKAFEELQDRVLQKVEHRLGNQVVKGFIICIGKRKSDHRRRKNGNK